jgi:hypothetical protein
LRDQVQRRIRLECPELPGIFISGRYSAETRQKAFDEAALNFCINRSKIWACWKWIQAVLTNALRAQASKE